MKNEIFNTGILEFSFEQNFDSEMEQQKTQREKQMMKLDLLQRSQSCHRDLLSSQLHPRFGGWCVSHYARCIGQDFAYVTGGHLEPMESL